MPLGCASFFERIHPFFDGNGRTGRAFIVHSCLQQNIPPIIISKEMGGGIYTNDGRWGRRWVDGDGINADTRRSTLIITNHVKMVYNESGLYCIVPVSEVIVWT